MCKGENQMRLTQVSKPHRRALVRIARQNQTNKTKISAIALHVMSHRKTFRKMRFRSSAMNSGTNRGMNSGMNNVSRDESSAKQHNREFSSNRSNNLNSSSRNFNSSRNLSSKCNQRSHRALATSHQQIPLAQKNRKARRVLKVRANPCNSRNKRLFYFQTPALTPSSAQYA